MKFLTMTDRYIYLARHWDKLTNIEMAKELEIAPASVSRMATKARLNGVMLEKKNEITKDNLEVDWDRVKKSSKWGGVT